MLDLLFLLGIFYSITSLVLPEQVLGGVADSRSGGRSSTHVGDSSQGLHGVLLGGVVKQTELQPLIVGELDRTCSTTTVRQTSIRTPKVLV